MSGGRNGRGGAVAWTVVGALALGFGLPACSHTKTVHDDQPSAQEDHSARHSKAARASADSEPAGGARTIVSSGGIPVSSTPTGLLADGALAKVRRALHDKGLLSGADPSDSKSLDEGTRAALRHFQRDQKMPETGLPDRETVSKLGLDPNEVFKHAPSASDHTGS